MQHLVHCLGILVLVVNAVMASEEASLESRRDFFERRVRPVLIEHCFKCHGRNNKAQNGLWVDNRNSLLKGGISGPSILPGKPEESLLIAAILRQADDVKSMPPDKPLPQKALESLIQWVRDGAYWPDASPSLVNEQTGREPATNLWSLLPWTVSEVPSVVATTWPTNGIDCFILSRLERQQLKPVADAGRRTMLRRVYFDLTGLPPTRSRVEAFLANRSPDRFERLVDRLLASPQFGERWGRHWLDVVRFAESSGKECNFTYPHAWPYRNYVIDSLNADKPYDRFLHEQLAGDLLPADPAANGDELQVATGFLAIGSKRHNAKPTEFMADIVDDQIDVTMRAFLGLTVACARCHDHKIDPIPQTDYYALAGIFQSTEPLYGTSKTKLNKNPGELVPIGADGHGKHEAAEKHEQLIKKTSAQLDAKKKDLLPQNEEPSKSAELSNGNLVECLKTEVAELEADLQRLKENRPTRPLYSTGARDRKTPADARIAIRGDPDVLGAEVPRGFLSCLRVTSTDLPPPEQSGRLELARWLTHPDNPLTARVMVNRIWHHLFGNGLVGTVDNFGSLGNMPSHPQLLDWLATAFVRQDWSTKGIIRSVVLSRSYRLNSRAAADTDGSVVSNAQAKDPSNKLLWRMPIRHLEVEAIRDAMLKTSGKLDTGRPQSSSVTALGDRLVRDIPLDELQPPSRYRSVYLPVIRDYLPVMFEQFDFPSPDLVSGRRSATIVPLQDLFLQNDPQVRNLAHAAANQLVPEQTDDAKLQDVFLRVLSRPPTDDERRDALAYLEHARATVRDGANVEVEVKTWGGLFHVLFRTAEFRCLVDID